VVWYAHGPDQASQITPYAGPRVSRANPMVARLLAATFPDYRGRKIELRSWDRPRTLENYWDGGTRSYWSMVEITTGRVGTPTNDNPFEPAAHDKWDLPSGWVAVEHIIFCGHDLGIRIYARAEDLARVTAGPARLYDGRWNQGEVSRGS